MARTIRIGTRGSLLARTQSEWVKARLEEHWGAEGTYRFELVETKTRGDRILDRPLSQVGGKGLFTQELEADLLAGGTDLAVHSLKDLPTESPRGLALLAVPEREDPRDVFVSRRFSLLSQLPPEASVGTSSLRRRAQLLALRPDLRVLDIRGNLDTRLRKLEEGLYEGILLARAGLERLSSASVITEVMDPDVFLPAPGQGALGIQGRDGDEEVLRILEPIRDRKAGLEVHLERSVLAGLGGGCLVPIGALGQVEGGTVRLRAMVSSLDGSHLIRADETGPVSESEGLVERVLAALRADGAGEILAGVRESTGKEPPTGLAF